MTALIALLFKIAGVCVLALATLGVLRFADPFQRMHAATKAGTLGAGLVLVGAIIAKGSPEAAVVAMLTLLLLIVTMPVAGHLLGRAAYVSGAPLSTRTDQLAGVLPRAVLPLEERERTASGTRSGTLDAPAPNAPGLDQRHDAPAEADFEAEINIPYNQDFDELRFAVIAPHAGQVARRARELTAASKAPISGIAIIDRACIEDARVSDAEDAIRLRLGEGLVEIREALDGVAQPVSLTYEIGDPMAIVPAPVDAGRQLLLLPSNGWFHHGANITLPVYEDRYADRLFMLADRHHGPTLFVGDGSTTSGQVVVVHDGSIGIQRLAAWALATRIWHARRVDVVGPASQRQLDDLEAIAADHGVLVSHVTDHVGGFRSLLPGHMAGATGIVLPKSALPRSAAAYRVFWQDRIAPGFRGDVLL